MRATIISRALGACSHVQPTVTNNLRVYNSLAKGLTPLLPDGGVAPISWYSCGPTVYDSAHLGHARTYVALDVLRLLTTRLTGKPILYAMGITDVDDKIIKRAAERNISPTDLARAYEAEFFEDMAALGVTPPTVVTRVTEHITEIVAYISKILERGLAYTTADGVYLDTAAMGVGYGKLMPSQSHGQGREEGLSPNGEPSDVDAIIGAAGKRSARDFALWKASRPGEPSWPSPWGPGRPGWHIECSAMTHAVFGGGLDVHAGGVDLAFPHHCNEIAQCEAHAGRVGASAHEGAADGAPGWRSTWCGVFLHTGHVHIAGSKMSKSLKNFITVREMMKQSGGSGSGAGYSADAFRVFVLSSRYRSHVTYSEDRLRDGQAWLARLGNVVDDAFDALGRAEGLHGERPSAVTGTPPSAPPRLWNGADSSLLTSIASTQAAIHAALCNDFDTPTALSSLGSLSSSLGAYVRTQGPSRVQPGLVRQCLGLIADELASYGLHAGAQLKGRLRPSAAVHLRAASSGALPAGAGDSATGEQDVSAASASESAVRALASFRDEARWAVAPLGKALKQYAKAHGASQAISAGAATSDGGAALAAACGSASRDLMAACDRVRDVHLPALGWACKDSPGGAVLSRTRG